MMPSKTYDIGFKKPPKSSQFKPGQSGNPKGRPSGTKNLATDLQEEMSIKISVLEGDKEHKLSKQRVLIRALSAKALKGNMKAMDTLIKMIERNTPKEVEIVEVSELSSDDTKLLEDFILRQSIKGEDHE